MTKRRHTHVSDQAFADAWNGAPDVPEALQAMRLSWTQANRDWAKTKARSLRRRGVSCKSMLGKGHYSGGEGNLR